MILLYVDSCLKNKIHRNMKYLKCIANNYTQKEIFILFSFFFLQLTHKNFHRNFNKNISITILKNEIFRDKLQLHKLFANDSMNFVNEKKKREKIAIEL